MTATLWAAAIAVVGAMSPVAVAVVTRLLPDRSRRAELAREDKQSDGATYADQFEKCREDAARMRGVLRPLARWLDGRALPIFQSHGDAAVTAELTDHIARIDEVM